MSTFKEDKHSDDSPDAIKYNNAPTNQWCEESALANATDRKRYQSSRAGVPVNIVVHTLCPEAPGSVGLYSCTITDGEEPTTVFGRVQRTAGVRMELWATTRALLKVSGKKRQVTIVTSSALVMVSLDSGELKKWGRRRLKGQKLPRKNADLWSGLYVQLREHKMRVVFQHPDAHVVEQLADRCALERDDEFEKHEKRRARESRKRREN